MHRGRKQEQNKHNIRTTQAQQKHKFNKLKRSTKSTVIPNISPKWSVAATQIAANSIESTIMFQLRSIPNSARINMNIPAAK